MKKPNKNIQAKETANWLKTNERPWLTKGSVEPEAAHKVLYSKQCRQFAPNSIERCALCYNHPGEHQFPVTAQRDAAIAACRAMLEAYASRSYETAERDGFASLHSAVQLAHIAIAKTEGGKI